MIPIPYSCPRGQTNCIALARIEDDNQTSFFCCGENDGAAPPVEQDIFTVCFKGQHRDNVDYYDKRDLAHQVAVLTQALAVVQAAHGDDKDWSPWASGDGSPAKDQYCNCTNAMISTGGPDGYPHCTKCLKPDRPPFSVSDTDHVCVGDGCSVCAMSDCGAPDNE